MSNSIITTKAKTLWQLQGQLKYAEVLPVYYFTVEKFKTCSDEVIKNIQSRYSPQAVTVRSSAISEDSLNSSNAGYYKSVLDVSSSDSKELYDAISKVIASYNGDLQDEVLIQPMLDNVYCAGVAFTADIDTLAPYYIINFDMSGETDSVTSGGGSCLHTFVYYRDASVLPPNKWIQTLILELKELEVKLESRFLDVEFAVGKNGVVYILQVRPIVKSGKEDLSKIDLNPLLKKIRKKVEKLGNRHPSLLGEKTFFGVMPDWNPAEIIGVKPKKLALTLYKELITDSIWAAQRGDYGYRSLKSHPLLVSFLGVPFIDVRVDFNSFIPDELDDKIAEKLVNLYLSELDMHHDYHDKIEFKIVHSCYHLTLDKKLGFLIDNGFSLSDISEIKKALLNITNSIIDPDNGLYKKDLYKIEVLKERYDEICESDISLIDKIYWLTEDCKTFGTLPFAGIARAAFIAVQFMESIVEVGIISKSEHAAFMNSLTTVSKQLSIDLNNLSTAILSKDVFLEKYGHLRPGTYDITSMRYDENFHNYFNDCFSEAKLNFDNELFDFSSVQLKQLDSVLAENGITVAAHKLIQFIKEAIEGREYAKLIFSRSLSKILQLIEELGLRFDVSKDDLAYLDFREILKLYVELDHRNMKDILRDNIELNKQYYLYTKAIRLPNLITSPEDVYSFFLESETPNFISLNTVEAEVISESQIAEEEISGKIVFVESADPGYDFLFTKGIVGLVTQYGGANSHMAIRCAELGLPAVIGAGEKNYETWLSNRIIRIDCATKQVSGVV